MNNIEKQVLIALKLYNVEFCNDDTESFPDGYYMSNEEDFDLPFEPKDWELDSNWNWIMDCVERIAKKENKTISNILHYFTINNNFNSVEDLFEIVFNYLNDKKN